MAFWSYGNIALKKIDWKLPGVILLLAVVFGAGGFVSLQVYKRVQEIKKERILLAKRESAWIDLQHLLQQEVSTFKGESGVVIKDLKMGWEWTYNPERLFPSASVVKVPMMVACFQSIQEGRIQLDTQLKLKASDRVAGSGMLKTMPVGSSFNIQELLQQMITSSDNTAANMLINLLGMDYLNLYFKKTGLSSTNLSRKMMDFSARKKGFENYTTAGDMALLLGKIYRKELLSPELSMECLQLMKQQRIRDRIPARIPKDTVVAHKTGLERFVCHDVGIVFTENGDYLICVLTQRKKQGPSKPAKVFISKVALDVYQYVKGGLHY